MPTRAPARIRFKARLLRPAKPAKADWAFLVLQQPASSKLPTRSQVSVDGTFELESPRDTARLNHRSAPPSSPCLAAAFRHAGPEDVAMHGHGAQRHQVEHEVQRHVDVRGLVQQRPARALEPQ